MARAGMLPQLAGNLDRIDSCLPPPSNFVAAAVNLTMMSSAQRDGELVADLASERPALGEAQVMGVQAATANQAGMLGHVSDVIAVTNPARLRQRQRALVDRLDRPAFWPFRLLGIDAVSSCSASACVCGYSSASVSRTPPVLLGRPPRRAGHRLPSVCSFRQAPMGPERGIIATAKIVDLTEEPIAQCGRCFGPKRRLGESRNAPCP